MTLPTIQDGFSVDSVAARLKTGKVCLMDADFIKYIIVSRIGKRIKNLTEQGQVAAREKFFGEEMHKWFQECIYDRIDDPIIFCFSGKSWNTFRYHMALEKEYKGNRSFKEDYPGCDVDAAKVIKYFIDNAVTLLFEDLEADDIVSALQCEDTYIASNDKDLKQVVGWHYDWTGNHIYEVGPEVAIRQLCYLIIAGDTSDNIPGLAGMGDVKANQFLDGIEPKDYLRKTLLLFQQRSGGQMAGYEYFNEQYCLVKTRTGRGAYFQSKYAKMFQIREMMVQEAKKLIVK